MIATIYKSVLAGYIIKRFNSFKNDLNTEAGQDDKLSYLSRLSEMHHLANAFGFEELAKEIREYMNEKL